MPKFVTVATFTLPTQLVIAKSKLESQNIECKVLDELTIQTDNFLSNALGGVKLQVQEKDIARAKQILEEGGFISNKPVQQSFIERKLSDPRIQSKIKTGAKTLFTLLAIIIALAIALSIFWRPSTTEKLTDRTWCLDHVKYAGRTYYPNTIGEGSGIKFVPLGSCAEIMKFNSDGSVIIPGFQSRAISGKWTLNDGGLRLSGVDTLGFVFEGLFTFEMTSQELILNSDEAQLFCTRASY